MKKSGTDQPDQVEPDDATLFRAAVGKVHPLPEQNRSTPPPPRRKPLLHRPAPAEPIPDTLSDFAAGEAADEYLGNGLSRLMLRKLRRGAWPAQDVLDLHGCHSDTARKLLQEFLHEAMQHGMRCVLVIHGKGRNSQSGDAVLRRLTRHWLIQHPHVLAYCDAPPQDGGSGAVLVLLKSNR